MLDMTRGVAQKGRAGRYQRTRPTSADWTPMQHLHIDFSHLTQDDDEVREDFLGSDSRVLEAKTDYLGELPGGIYRRQRDDIESVWSMLESPIEQVAIFQLAAGNYAYDGPPQYARIASKRGEFPLYQYPVQIIPQVVFGPYRVDFLFDLLLRRPMAVECDGAEFHQDKVKDAARDEHLRSRYGVSVFRIPGKSLWKNNMAAQMVIELIQAKMR